MKARLTSGTIKKKALLRGLSYRTMIDSTLIELNNVSIPETLPFFKGDKGSRVWIQRFNPTSEHYRKHGYLPNFTIARFPSKYNNSWFVQRLVIQSSVPKVLHGSNYFGADETDYEPYVHRLAELSNLVGLPITTTQLKSATLRIVAFCFNFNFGAEYPYPKEYLKKMSLLDIGKRHKEVKNTNFIEATEGYQGKFYNGRVGFGLYDQRSRLINDARTPIEFELLEKMKRGEIPDRVLRMEVTYQNQTAVKQHLKTLLGGVKGQVRFLSDVFINNLAQSILSDIFEKLADDVNVKAVETPILPIESAIKSGRSSGMSLFEAEAWLGHSLAIQQMGSLHYKELQDRYYHRQRRADLGKRYKKILEKNPLPKSTLENIFDKCREQLLEFRIIKPQPQHLTIS